MIHIQIGSWKSEHIFDFFALFMEKCGGVFVSAVSSKQNQLQIGSWKNSVVFLTGSWKMILVILIQIQIT
jgi:hypothetical protein